MAPIAVATPSPGVIFRSGEEFRWAELNRAAGGNPDFDPATIKAAHLLGTMGDICESVEQLLRHPLAWPVTYPSAFAAAASAVEILGRCIRGNQSDGGSGKDLSKGFEYLADRQATLTSQPAGDYVVRRTSHHTYTIGELVALRNFAAHGQAVWRNGPHGFDVELLDNFPQLIGDAAERYWACLLSDSNYSDNLVQANLLALQRQSERVERVWRAFGQGASVGELFYRFNWHVSGR